MDDVNTGQNDGSVDEEFRALLEGLRTSLPGVQVLFAFLLTAPLQGGFADLTAHERTAFSIAFYAAGISSVLLIAPSVHQRIRAPLTGLQRRSKVHLIWTTWVTIAGSVTMGVAMLATTYLVSHFLYKSTPAFIATGLVATTLVWAWFYLPLVTFNRLGNGHQTSTSDRQPTPGETEQAIGDRLDRD